MIQVGDYVQVHGRGSRHTVLEVSQDPKTGKPKALLTWGPRGWCWWPAHELKRIEGQGDLFRGAPVADVEREIVRRSAIAAGRAAQ